MKILAIGNLKKDAKYIDPILGDLEVTRLDVNDVKKSLISGNDVIVYFISNESIGHSYTAVEVFVSNEAMHNTLVIPVWIDSESTEWWSYLERLPSNQSKLTEQARLIKLHKELKNKIDEHIHRL